MTQLLLGLSLTLLAGHADGEPGSLWMTDLAKAEKEARKTGNPLFVVFRCEH
jgi:hypothetical protein